MSRWNSFLASLSTRGGAIFVLLVLSFTGFGITIHLIHHNEASGQIAAGLITTLGNFTGALLLALKGSSETSATATVSPGGGASVTTGDSSASTSEVPKK